MKILVIANTYPSLQKPNFGAFVYNFLQELKKQENEIITIAPMKVQDFFKRKHSTYGKERCKVYRPLYYSFSNKNIGGINTKKITSYFYDRAVCSMLNKLEKPEVIYTHFFSNAIPVLDYASQNNIPIVVASGESTYVFLEKESNQIQTKLKKSVSQIICVSDKNKQSLINLGFDEHKIYVIPNAVDYSLFKPLDKDACKEKLGIPKDKFTIGFIGHFIHRKGPNRVIEAIGLLNDESVHLICVGNGEDLKQNNFTTQIPPVPNYLLQEIYNAFDIFVLPTLNEGHCNVIEEAKACGVPIISSKGTSVEEQLDDSIGILVNPLDIKEIANAILELKNNKISYNKMTQNLIERRGENSLKERASKINKILAHIV